MDSVYDAPFIRNHIKSPGHVLFNRPRPTAERRSKRTTNIWNRLSRNYSYLMTWILPVRKANKCWWPLCWAERRIWRHDYSGSGHINVLTYPMFGISVSTAVQPMRLTTQPFTWSTLLIFEVLNQENMEVQYLKSVNFTGQRCILAITSSILRE